MHPAGNRTAMVEEKEKWPIDRKFQWQKCVNVFAKTIWHFRLFRRRDNWYERRAYMPWHMAFFFVWKNKSMFMSLIQSTFNMSDTQIHNVIWIYVYVLYNILIEAKWWIPFIQCAVHAYQTERKEIRSYYFRWMCCFFCSYFARLFLCRRALWFYSQCASLSRSLSLNLCVWYMCVWKTQFLSFRKLSSMHVLFCLDA